jgi:hypothetical protein
VTSELTQLSPNEVLIALLFVGDPHADRTINVSIQADLDLDGNDDSPCERLASGNGFMVYSQRYILTWLLRSTPLVSDVSSFWFGRHLETGHHLWTQVQDDKFWGEDSAMTFSWQNVHIPAGHHVTKSAIAKMGRVDMNQLTLVIIAADIPGTVTYHQSFPLRGLISSDNPHANVSFEMIVDSDVSTIHRVATSVAVNAEFDIQFTPGKYEVLGSHQLSIFAIDEVGTLSEASTFHITVTGPTKTLSKTPLATPSHTPTESPSKSQSRRPVPTLPPQRPLPIRVECSGLNNFDITGLTEYDRIVHVTYYQQGFATRLKVGDDLSETALDCRPLLFHGVTMHTNVTHLAENTLLVSFRLVNSNPTTSHINLEVDADTRFDDDDYAPVRSVASQRGFIIYSDRHQFTMIGRGSSLVDNVTTYWFGEHSGRERHCWTQVQEEAVWEFDSAVAFSWQDIQIPAHVVVGRSVIMKFGFPDQNYLHLTCDLSQIGEHLNIQDTATISANIQSSPGRSGLRSLSK